MVGGLVFGNFQMARHMDSITEVLSNKRPFLSDSGFQKQISTQIKHALIVLFLHMVKPFKYVYVRISCNKQKMVDHKTPR